MAVAIKGSLLFNMDCMDYLRELPDNAFELAIVDPSYGIGHSIIAGEQSGQKYGNAAAPKKNI